MKITSVETIALRDDAADTVTTWNPSFSKSGDAPDRPGLGFELNEDVISEFRVDPY